MKNIVVLYAGNMASDRKSSGFQFERVFGKLSAFERSLIWAMKIKDSCRTLVFCTDENKVHVEKSVEYLKTIELEGFPGSTGFGETDVFSSEMWTSASLLRAMSVEAGKHGAASVVYACSDTPFLDPALTEKLLEFHSDYNAEYTFQEGYPYGFAPEILDSGAASIIASLAEGNCKSEGDKTVSRESIFSIVRGDINSFEIENLISPEDFRLLRLDLSCSMKAGFEACRNLYALLSEKGIASDSAWGLVSHGKKDDSWSDYDMTVLEVSNIAKCAASVLQTVPAFYNIQVEGRCEGKCVHCPYPAAFSQKYGENVWETSRRMEIGDFSSLAGQIAALSGSAVVSLSLWGEPLLCSGLDAYVGKVLEHDGLSVLIECNASSLVSVTAGEGAGMLRKIAEMALQAGSRNGLDAVTWVVSIDAADKIRYAALHGNDAYENIIEAVRFLKSMFNGTYVQFLRMEENEDELEAFYRFWNEKESPSGGKLIIQKYDDFCGRLPPRKSADLSPVHREPCWHLRRDMDILFDGTVPMCRECLLCTDCDSLGNVFSDGLLPVWKNKVSVLESHIAGQYPEKCRKCDEYYTFNF